MSAFHWKRRFMGAGVLTSEVPWSVPQKLPTMFVVEPPSSCVLLMAILVALASAARGTRELGIYGGDRATTEDYPFAAILCSRMYSGDWCDAICTASLVSPGVIMTAAHCFNDFMGLFELDNNFQGREAYERRVLSSYRVIFGENASGPHLTSKAVRVKKIVVAEPFSFEEGSPSWDVALVFLEDCNDEVEYGKFGPGQPVEVLRSDGTWTLATVAEFDETGCTYTITLIDGRQKYFVEEEDLRIPRFLLLSTANI